MPTTPRRRRQSSSSATSSSSAGPTSEHDDPFQLIERGNALQASGNMWGAADAFGVAALALRSQSHDVVVQLKREEEEEQKKKASSSKDGTHDITSRKREERWKIAALYLDQSREYLYKARDALLHALAFENSEDRKRVQAIEEAFRDSKRGPKGKLDSTLQQQLEPLTMMLTPDEGQRRVRIFNRIYALSYLADRKDGEKADETMEGRTDEKATTAAKIGRESRETKEHKDAKAKTEGKESTDTKDGEKPTGTKKDGTTNQGRDENTHQEHMEEKQLNIEERLAELNLSLPSGFKTDAQRLADIDEGLARLGLPSAFGRKGKRRSAFQPLVETKPLSDEEQLRQIIEQAKDEAKLEGNNNAPDDIHLADADAATVDATIPSIADDEDLSSILIKSGMTSDMKDLAKGLSEKDEQVMKSSKAAVNEPGTLKDKTKLLQILSLAQTLLVEASAHLEHDIDGGIYDSSDEEGSSFDEEEAEIMGTEAALDKTAKKKESSSDVSKEKGKKKLVEAKRCLEKVISSWT